MFCGQTKRKGFSKNHYSTGVNAVFTKWPRGNGKENANLLKLISVREKWETGVYLHNHQKENMHTSLSTFVTAKGLTMGA